MRVDRKLDKVVGIDKKNCDRIKHIKSESVFRTPSDIVMEGWAVLDALLPIILYHRKGCLVEIGIGVSTFFMCKGGYDFKRTVYSVDTNSSKINERDCSRFFPGHKAIWTSSKEFIEDFDEPCAVVLIDGAHDYDTAKMEFDFFFGKLVEGGVIFIHDTYPPVAGENDPAAFLQKYACGNVYRLRQELEKRRDEMEIFTWPYTAGWAGLTMVLKKEKDLPYWGK